MELKIWGHRCSVGEKMDQDEELLGIKDGRKKKLCAESFLATLSRTVDVNFNCVFINQNSIKKSCLTTIAYRL